MWTSKAMRRPVPLACSTTLFAIVLLAAGLTGYRMSRHAAFVAGTHWSGTVIWPQVFVGLVLLVLSVWLWRRAVRSLHA
jgi:membrane protein implicated in regulation of membrane protease activity